MTDSMRGPGALKDRQFHVASGFGCEKCHIGGHCVVVTTYVLVFRRATLMHPSTAVAADPLPHRDPDLCKRKPHLLDSAAGTVRIPRECHHCYS